MKKEITRLICAAICCTPIIGFAQTGDKFTSTDNLYKEGKELFQEKNYAAALPALKAFVKQKPVASLLQDAEYMLVSSAYELKDKNRIELLRKYLDRYPADRVFYKKTSDRYIVNYISGQRNRKSAGCVGLVRIKN